MARTYAVPAIAALFGQTTDRRIPARERRAAAKLLLRIGFGRGVDIAGELTRLLGWPALAEQLQAEERAEKLPGYDDGDAMMIQRHAQLSGDRTLLDGKARQTRRRLQPAANWLQATSAR